MPSEGVWLRQQESNLPMGESKSPALPLGDGAAGCTAQAGGLRHAEVYHILAAGARALSLDQAVEL